MAQPGCCRRTVQKDNWGEGCGPRRETVLTQHDASLKSLLCETDQNLTLCPTSPSVLPTLCASMKELHTFPLLPRVCLVWGKMVRMARGTHRKVYEFCSIVKWGPGLEEWKGIICLFQVTTVTHESHTAGLTVFGKFWAHKGLGMTARESKFGGCSFIHLMDTEGL